MNRSLFQMAMLATYAHTSASASTSLPFDTRHAGPDYNFMLKNDQDGLPDAGGTEVSATEAKGEVISDVMGDGIKVGGEQQAAASDSSTQAGTLDAKPAEDLGGTVDSSLATGTAVKDPPAGDEQAQG